VRNPEPVQNTGHADVGARVMLVFLCLLWGVSWPLMKIALLEIPPFSMRSVTTAIGALTLYAFCRIRGASLSIPNAKTWGHVIVSSFLNVVAFIVFGSLAQLTAATSRVTILAYTMPIWAVLLAWPILGEKPNRVQWFALFLCIAGLTILISPLAETGIAPGIWLALLTGILWGAGTVYLKWAQIKADPIGVASWQVTIAFVVITSFMFIFEGHPRLSGAHAPAIAAMITTGFFANGVAYGLWFAIIRRLPAVTASLGVLGSPTVGVIASILMLGERPTVTDLIGFALIFAASACVLLARRAPVEATTQPT